MENLETGRLTQLLPGFRIPVVDVGIVFLNRREMPPNSHAFAGYLKRTPMPWERRKQTDASNRYKFNLANLLLDFMGAMLVDSERYIVCS